jgi:type IV secretion system protein VirB11
VKSPREIQDERFTALLMRQLGPQVLGWLEDPDLTDFMVNADGRAWVCTHSRGMFDAGFTLPPTQVEAIIGTVAAAIGTVADANHPIIEGELHFNRVRFEGLMPPIVEAASMALRKPAQVLFTLADYVRDKIIRPSWATVLSDAVAHKESIVLAGVTGSGKTTLAAALLNEMVERSDPTDRYVVLEDTREIQCRAENVLFLRSNDKVDLTRLVRAAMRLFPTRIIVGETRGADALALLKAWLTHLGGVTSVHAVNVKAALSRLNAFVQEAGVPAQPELIAETVNLILLIEGIGKHRRVTELARVEGYSPSEGFKLSPV